MHSVRIGRNMYKLRPFAAPVLGEVLPSHTHCCAASGARARRSCTYSDRFKRSAVLQAERERVELLHMLHEFLKNGCSDGAAWHCDAKVVGDGRAYGREGVAIFEPAIELH